MTKTKRPRIRTLERLAAALAVALILYALAGFELAPYLIERAVERYDARTPRRSVAVARVAVNPFTMAVELDRLALRDLTTGVDLTVAQTRLNVSIATLTSRSVVLDALTIRGAHLSLSAPNWRGRLGAVLKRLAAGAAAKPPALRIARLGLSDGRIDLGTARAPDRLSLRDIALSCAARTEHGRLHVAAAKASGRRLELRLGEGAVLAAATLRGNFDGTVTPQPSGFLVDADTMLDGTAVSVANAPAPVAAALRLQSVSAKLRVQYGSGAPTIGGTVAADGLLVKRAAGDGRGLAADHVGAYALSVTGSPPVVDVDRVRVSGISGTVDIAPVAAALLPGWLRRAVDPYAAPAGGAPGLTIGRVDVDGGALKLTDTSVDPAPSLSLRRVQATLSGLRPGGGPAVAKLTASLGDSGSATLDARLRPLAPDGFSRVDIRADGVDAAVLSPYARRFAGVPVSAGRLSGELSYRISGGRADGSAQLAVHGLALGARAGDVPAPLPLAFAAALLDDPKGDIELAVPLAAAVGRPDPYVPGIVGGALAAAIMRTADAPFAVLGRAIGASADSLNAVPFEPGSAAVSTAGKSVLMHLAAALAQRPGVGVTVGGAFDAAADRKALAVQEIRLQVALATASADQFDAAQPSAPPPLDFTSPRVQSVLDEFAGQRLGTQQVKKLAGSFANAHASAPAARASYYHALFDALVAKQAVPGRALQRLGRYRAQAVVEALTGLGVAAARVERSGTPEPVAAPQLGAASVPVMLGLRALAGG